MRLAIAMATGGRDDAKIEGGGKCFRSGCEACVERYPRLTGWLGVKVVVAALQLARPPVQHGSILCGAVAIARDRER